MNDSMFAALARGTASDAFAILGPHLETVEATPTLVIRAWNPAADAIDVIRPEQRGDGVPMDRRGPAGLFELRWPGQATVFDYRLRIAFAGGVVHEIDDPYRYGRVISEFDQHLFAEGKLQRAFDKLGAHIVTIGSATGVHFAVWAPSAQRVSVVGDFNAWDGRVHPMRDLKPSGLWEIFIPGLREGERYKFEIRSSQGMVLHKSDPYAFQLETPPRSASIIWNPDTYVWRDAEWMAGRAAKGAWLDRPMAVYEVHFGSWARPLEEPERLFTYREMAELLIPYVKEMGYTHIQLLPIMEHPFFGSWGYQVTGFFAPTSRFGSPDDFKWFVDECHLNGIGVILDWVPAHFPKDAHGLARFDGTAVYEHADPRQGEHQDWGTLIFNYGRDEVRTFLLSNALFWLEHYHADGLRVDAVASMLYLDYSRSAGEWVPNKFGGRENLDAIALLREVNALTHGAHPGTMTIAEESTSWPAVSRPVYLGGLGFTYKWNMGWMHDILKYAANDPVFRRYAHNNITFSMLYAFSENFVLPFSHDEVVHMKGSLLNKMPGDLWQKCANLRAFYGFMYGHPGKKLLFMGGEFGQAREWNHDRSLDWHLLQNPFHDGLRRFVRDLNAMYTREPSLHEVDFDPAGFQWIDCNDNENSVVSFLRRAKDPADFTVLVLNFTPVPRYGYQVGVPIAGRYVEMLNSDAQLYGGSNVGNNGSVETLPAPAHGHSFSLRLTLPPLGFLLFKPERSQDPVVTRTED